MPPTFWKVLDSLNGSPLQVLVLLVGVKAEGDLRHVLAAEAAARVVLAAEPHHLPAHNAQRRPAASGGDARHLEGPFRRLLGREGRARQPTHCGLQVSAAVHRIAVDRGQHPPHAHVARLAGRVHLLHRQRREVQVHADRDRRVERVQPLRPPAPAPLPTTAATLRGAPRLARLRGFSAHALDLQGFRYREARQDGCDGPQSLEQRHTLPGPN